MRRLPDLPACALLLAMAGPAQATAPKELCEALALMEAVLTLPSQEDTPRRSAKTEQRLIVKAQRALATALRQRALPVATIEQYREIVSDRLNGHSPDPGQSETLDRVTRKVQQGWRRDCRRAEDHRLAPDKPGATASGTRWLSGTEPQHLVRGSSERSNLIKDRVYSTLSGITPMHKWWMPATLIIAVVVGLIGKAYGEIQARRKRRARRFVCDLAGRLSSDTGKVPVRIRDISRLGCLLQIDRGPAAKTRCHVGIQDRWLEARVAWSNRCYVGLEFKQIQSREFVIGVARSGRREGPATPLAPAQMPRQST